MDAHSHNFDPGNPLAERKTLYVVIITAVMMLAEITCGWWFHSMALLADGWHMSSHALAMGLSVMAYVFARRLKEDSRFAFGTWKIEVLGGYTSALCLVGVAFLMLYQSTERLLQPVSIQYDEAIFVSVIGLVVNLVCALLLQDNHHHHHHNDHTHDHSHHDDHHEHHGHHHDLNLRSAYLHVVADAATSVLAIAALIGGKYWNATFLDPVMGIVGGFLVLIWAYGLIRDTARVLLDAEMNSPVVNEIRDVIAAAPIAAQICDLHLWRVGKGKFACVISLATSGEASPDFFRDQLKIHEELVHVTVEINKTTAPSLSAIS